MDILDDMGVSKLSAKVFFKSGLINIRTSFCKNHGTETIQLKSVPSLQLGEMLLYILMWMKLNQHQFKEYIFFCHLCFLI